MLLVVEMLPKDTELNKLGFDSRYGFQSDFQYYLRHIDGNGRAESNKILNAVLNMAQGEFELGAVEFCTFQDMLP